MKDSSPSAPHNYPVKISYYTSGQMERSCWLSWPQRINPGSRAQRRLTHAELSAVQLKVLLNRQF